MAAQNGSLQHYSSQGNCGHQDIMKQFSSCFLLCNQFFNELTLFRPGVMLGLHTF
jgi:hypothetical protein